VILLLALLSCAYDPVECKCARSHTVIVMVPYNVGKTIHYRPQPTTVCDERECWCTRDPDLDAATCRERYPEAP
jgi:hypothetical protein